MLIKLIILSIFLLGQARIAIPEAKYHTIKFYLDSRITTMSYAKQVLPKYVSDMNYILAKNTARILVFNPNTDIVLTRLTWNNNGQPPYPTSGFRILVDVAYTDNLNPYGGTAGNDITGDGVVTATYWHQLYNRDSISGLDVTRYWTQVGTMLHEIAHIFNAGLGEYYSLCTIYDKTGTIPALDIHCSDAGDRYWKDKPDFKYDPLMNAAPSQFTTVSAFRQGVRYSNLTAAIITNEYRNSFPMVNLSAVKVKTNPGARVRIWKVEGHSPWPAAPVYDGYADAGGYVTFNWTYSVNPHNNYDYLRLIKITKNGYFPEVLYRSIYDADIVSVVNGGTNWEINVPLHTITNFYLPLYVVQ